MNWRNSLVNIFQGPFYGKWIHVFYLILTYSFLKTGKNTRTLWFSMFPKLSYVGQRCLVIWRMPNAFSTSKTTVCCKRHWNKSFCTLPSTKKVLVNKLSRNTPKDASGSLPPITQLRMIIISNFKHMICNLERHEQLIALSMKWR